MSDDLVTPDNLSKELLKSLFDSAFLETSWDDEGDLRVKDRIRCFALPSENKDRIRLLAIFGFKDGATPAQRLECVNNINREYIMVRAAIGSNGVLRFDHDIYVKGGVTKKNVVLATKRFLSIPLEAIEDHGKELVV